jgi:hypothetical protein
VEEVGGAPAKLTGAIRRSRQVEVQVHQQDLVKLEQTNTGGGGYGNNKTGGSGIVIIRYKYK